MVKMEQNKYPHFKIFRIEKTRYLTEKLASLEYKETRVLGYTQVRRRMKKNNIKCTHTGNFIFTEYFLVSKDQMHSLEVFSKITTHAASFRRSGSVNSAECYLSKTLFIGSDSVENWRHCNAKAAPARPHVDDGKFALSDLVVDKYYVHWTRMEHILQGPATPKE